MKKILPNDSSSSIHHQDCIHQWQSSQKHLDVTYWPMHGVSRHTALGQNVLAQPRGQDSPGMGLSEL
eukprot:1424030-Karenia_brevis.AAC.1